MNENTPYLKIEEFTQVITGGTPSTNIAEYWDNGTIPWLQSGVCQNCDVNKCSTFITQKGLDNSSAKMMKAGSVLIALTGATAGKVGYLTFSACGNQSITGIQPDPSFISRYLFYYLLTLRKKILDDCVGGGQPHISQKYVKNIQVPLPDIVKQQHIVSVLDTVNSLIDTRKKQIALLDEAEKSLFVEMFGDPVENPKGWDISELGKRCSIITGNTPPRNEPKNYGSFVEWIKSDNINDNSPTLSTAKEYLSEVGAKKARCVDKNSILMTCIAGSLNSIGNVAITDRYVAFNQQINAIVPNNEDVMYLYFLFKIMKKRIQNSVSMSLKGILSKSKLSSIEYMYPPFSLQKEFAARISSIEERRREMEAGLQQMEEARSALMQQYFG